MKKLTKMSAFQATFRLFSIDNRALRPYNYPCCRDIDQCRSKHRITKGQPLHDAGLAFFVGDGHAASVRRLRRYASTSPIASFQFRLVLNPDNSFSRNIRRTVAPQNPRRLAASSTEINFCSVVVMAFLSVSISIRLIHQNGNVQSKVSQFHNR